MNLPELVKGMFKEKEKHTAKVLIIGGTDQTNFEAVWSKHDIEEYTSDMDANASKNRMVVSPVAVLLEEGEGGYIDARITLPLQGWVSDLRIEPSIEESKDLQRITDWVAGFMEVFCMNSTITGLDISTGAYVFSDEKHSVLKLDDILKRPKKDKGDLMMDDQGIGSVEDILSGQLTQKEIDTFVQGKPEASVEAVEVPVAQEEAGSTHTAMRATQEEIVAKYGYQALKDLVARTGQPLLIKKSK